MKTIKNTNGYTYNVLDEHGQYMLVQCIETKEYVIAYNFDRGSWDSGQYTYNKDIAYEYYKSKVISQSFI